VTFDVGANPGGADREDTISIAGQTHTIHQYGTAAPSNDLFAGAQVITGINNPPNMPVTGYNTTATAEAGEPTHAGNPPAKSVWYKWTAPAGGLYSFSTSGSSFDTVMEIYECPASGGCSFANMTSVGANDDTTSFDTTSKVNFRATGAAQYYIAIDGKNGASGTIELTWRQYARLFRLYLQNYNGNRSGFVPDSVIASNGTNTVIPTLVSQGVYEFNLPADNTTYIATISGPTGIVWDPNNFPLDTSFRLLDELMHGPEEGGQNNTANAGNETPRYITGYVRNITAQEIGSLSVNIGSSRGPNPRDAVSCGPLNPQTIGSVPYAVYQCLTQPETNHDIVPNMGNKNFVEEVRSYDHPIEEDTFDLPSMAIAAAGGATYNINGHVLSGGVGTIVELFYTPIGNTHEISLRTRTDATGYFEFLNMVPNTYRLRARRDGEVYNNPASFVLQAPGVTVDISPLISCTYTASTVGSFPVGGGTGQFTITTNSPSCTWTAQSMDSWIQINSSGGLGTGPVQFTVDPNTGGPRTGVIRAGGQDVQIVQAGCSYTITTPSQVNFPATGGSGTFDVNTTSDCPWTPQASDYCMVSVSGGTSGNGTVNFTVSANHGVARTAVISVGGQTVTLTQAAAPGEHHTAFDFDGDGKADISVFRPSTTAGMSDTWYVYGSLGMITGREFGSPGDIRAAADFDGDHKTDIAVFRPSQGYWFWVESSTQQVITYPFGLAGDIPVPADYDGNGQADLAVFRPSTGIWYILLPGGVQAIPFGLPEDKPVPADYDGDGHTDVAVYRPSQGAWYILQSTGGVRAQQFGVAEDVPVPRDFDGDGRADLAVYRNSTNYFYRLDSSTNNFVPVQFGLPGDKPVPADYNGDTFADIAVYRPSTGYWYIWSCTNNPTISSATPFGISEDLPVPYPVTP